MTEFIKRFTPLNFDNPINQGLVGYYPLNERSGPVAFDMSKNNNPGDLINNPTHVQSGRFGDVLDFGQSFGQHIDCGVELANSLGNDVSALSISLWVISNDPNDNKGFFTISDFSGTQGEISIRAAFNNLTLRLSNSGFNQSIPFTDSINWHNIIAQFTGTRAKLYLDNTKVIDSPWATNLNLVGLKTIVGAYLDIGSSFKGKIKNVRIYNRVLQPAEIKTLFMSRS